MISLVLNSKGTNTKYLTLGILNDIMIQVPNGQVRKKFDDAVERVGSVKSKMQMEGMTAEMNSNSLTQRAFRGEL